MDQLTVYQSPYPKTRIGALGDGGYVVSALPTTYDVLISGGVSNDISFEQDFLNRYPTAKCFAFDGTVDGLPTTDPRITFVKKNLGAYETDITTNLESYFNEYDNIFLKLDIEGHEFRILPVLLKHFHKIKQIVLEIHSSMDILLHPYYYQGLSDVTHDTMFGLLRDMNKTHTLVHIHGNNGCETHTFNGIGLPNVFECTYVRNDFIPTKVLNDVPFPHALDYPNSTKRPDYVLKGFPFSTNTAIQSISILKTLKMSR